MTCSLPTQPRVAIACGGTGGHLFPGLAVAELLVQRGCAVTLLVSPKEVDQQAVKRVRGMEVATLPAVGLTRRQVLAFVRGFGQSYRAARGLLGGQGNPKSEMELKEEMPAPSGLIRNPKQVLERVNGGNGGPLTPALCPSDGAREFERGPVQAVLAMGGFTSAPPILAAKRLGARTFLHESNTIPGRANRWLSWIVDGAFVGFPETAARLHCRQVTVTGTPVRPQFQNREAAACRAALGLDPVRPVVLVMGGSQGANGINDLVLQALPVLAQCVPQWQWFHLTGPNQVEKVRQAYAALHLNAVVHPFFGSMELALGAASAAISRAGASSLAELAAMRLPAILVPYPAATDNHQFFNARAFEQTGAARLLEQKGATTDQLVKGLLDLVQLPTMREPMQRALEQWQAPQAAERIAEVILNSMEREGKFEIRNSKSETNPNHEWTPINTNGGNQKA